MARTSWRIMPTTLLGRWSVGASIAMPLLFNLGTSFINSLYLSVPAGNNIMADIGARPALAHTMLMGMMAGIVALITGLLAVIRQRERAILVYISTLIGALLVLFLAARYCIPIKTCNLT
jgi:hypothetical protein